MDFVVAQLENGFLKETRFLSKKPVFSQRNPFSLKETRFLSKKPVFSQRNPFSLKETPFLDCQSLVSINSGTSSGIKPGSAKEPVT